MELFPKYYFGIIFTLLLAGMLFYLRAAKKWSITDNPNERSSHKQITLRGGGLIYLFGLGLYLIFSNFNIYLLVTSGVFLGIVGFIDDIKNLSFKIKLLFQLIIITIYLLGTIYLLDWYLIVLIFIDLSWQPITRSLVITSPFFPRCSDISASRIFILFPLCLNQTPGYGLSPLIFAIIF